MQNWQYGILVGLLPSISMLGSSILLMNVNVPALIEASFQNICAGLILGACGSELFPIVSNIGTKFDMFCGITIGFAFSMFSIHGLAYIADHVSGNIVEVPNNKNLDGKLTKEGYQSLEENNWDASPIKASVEAINTPTHRSRLKEDLVNIESSVDDLQLKSSLVLQRNMSSVTFDILTEQIDEDIHKLQYKVDKARRHLEGTSRSRSGSHSKDIHQLVFDDRNSEIYTNLAQIKSSIRHLIEHIDAKGDIDEETLTEIHLHIEELDAQLSGFHTRIESVSSKWHTRRMPETVFGEKIPMGLAIPVCMDAVTDGFLIGITCAVSRKGGLILGFANCLEMAFLGMAFTSRVIKCTGSSLFLRNLTVVAPPFLMMAASGIGAYIGDSAKQVPMLFIAFIAFGIVALVFLVCTELIIEAKISQGNDERWWVTGMIFFGIYIVLIMNIILPSEGASSR